MFENLLFDPPFPQPVIYGLGIALALLAMVAYWRRTTGVGKFGATVLLLFRLSVIGRTDIRVAATDEDGGRAKCHRASRCFPCWWMCRRA